MHDCGLPRGQPKGPQGHVAVEEAALVDQAEDLSAGDLLVRPVWKEMKHILFVRDLVLILSLYSIA